jgi:uncharacterized membrane-anchored protein
MTKTEALKNSLLVKVPAVTIFFWIIKVLSTTVGETIADYVNSSFGLSDNSSAAESTRIMNMTALVMSGILLGLLIVQFATRRYVPAIYWTSIVAISALGTMIADNLHTNYGWQNWQLTIMFGAILLTVFALWWSQERTLSIKSINTRKREAFYWVAILATFAMGTAAGDIFLDDLGWPLTLSSVLFAAVIALLALLWRFKIVGTVFAFWAIYVLTRPLGASVGDYLSLDAPDGLGYGPGLVSGIALTLIGALTLYLSISKRDVIRD